MIFLVKLLEGAKTREEISPSNLQHNPRVAIDAFGNKHVAVQYGPGDSRIRIQYQPT